MVVGVDQAGHHQAPRRLNDFKIVFGCEARADGCDPVVFDEDVGDRRMMDVAIMVIDLPAPDQQFIGPPFGGTDIMGQFVAKDTLFGPPCLRQDRFGDAPSLRR